MAAKGGTMVDQGTVVYKLEMDAYRLYFFEEKAE